MFFSKKGCAHFWIPYTAHPPTRSETKVTQRVGKREKELKKTLDSQNGKRKIRTPNDEALMRQVS
ncbi:hypothetical protein BSZ04_24110 [Vibrio rotiferianus]|nr:hypothetical protein BSZ04_24110 [Vibrio rotiferianus]